MNKELNLTQDEKVPFEMEESKPRELHGKCNMCGICCKAIGIIHSVEHLESMRIINNLSVHGDIEFILANWQPITREEAFATNPYLAKVNKDNAPGAFWYKCLRLDNTTNRCSVHGKKPRICSEYPWYDRAPYKGAIFSEDCGYVVDLETE